MVELIVKHLNKHLALLFLILVNSIVGEPTNLKDSIEILSEVDLVQENINSTLALNALKISRIILDGNNKTKDKWILGKIGFTEGDVYDSLKISEAEQKLKDSRLFSFVKIYPIKAVNKITILITVRERRYFKITDYSGAMYSKKWGQPSKTFLQAYGAFKLENFRGMEEELKLSLSFWTIRYLSLSWYKPFIKNPYFIQIGSTIGSQPSIVSPWNLDFYNLSYIYAGRRFSTHSKLSIGVDGRYKKYSWKGGNGAFKKNGKYTSTSEYPGDDKQFTMSNDWKDTIIDTVSGITNTYEWISNDSTKVNFYQKPFTESYIHLKWITDKRDNYYNSHSGFLTAFRLSSNILYPFQDKTDSTIEERSDAVFIRLGSDMRFYHRGISKKHTIAYRVQPTFTLHGKGSRYSGMYMGDIGSLRGYGSGYFGSYKYNNRFLLSLEYRFPLFKMPDLKFPFLAWYDKGMANLSTQFDGAFIMDYGRIWMKADETMHNFKEAMGLGLGIRVISPNVKRSLCFDVVWGLPAADQSKKGKPAWYLYIDMPY